jgi:hypothetical protein
MSGELIMQGALCWLDSHQNFAVKLMRKLMGSTG